MRHRSVLRLVFACVGFAACSPPALAQDGGQALETIVVTGSRISYRDLLDTPAVSVTVPGDYLLLEITLVNDTRSEDGRKREIYATIEKMLAGAGKRFELVYNDAYPRKLTAQSFEVPLAKEDKRPDVSKVSLSVRTPIGGEPAKAEELTRALRTFVEKAERVGRTEIDTGSETALSLSRPERFRYDLVKAIATDTAKVRSTVGAGCKVQIEGLSSRIEWARASASELLLYIPYHMTIQECGAAG
ncbi:MAG TPA: hypothetical protein VFB32_11250 [Rudaea sp.]|nr:hypothetical protein [Rudaea sp.]